MSDTPDPYDSYTNRVTGEVVEGAVVRGALDQLRQEVEELAEHKAAVKRLEQSTAEISRTLDAIFDAGAVVQVDGGSMICTRGKPGRQRAAKDIAAEQLEVLEALDAITVERGPTITSCTVSAIAEREAEIRAQTPEGYYDRLVPPVAYGPPSWQFVPKGA